MSVTENNLKDPDHATLLHPPSFFTSALIQTVKSNGCFPYAFIGSDLLLMTYYYYYYFLLSANSQIHCKYIV